MPEPHSMTGRRRPAAPQPDPAGSEPVHHVDTLPAGLAVPVIGSTQPAAIDYVGETAGPPVFGAGSTGLTGSKGSIRWGDRVMFALTSGAGASVVALIALVALFLLIKAVPAITGDRSN